MKEIFEIAFVVLVSGVCVYILFFLGLPAGYHTRDVGGNYVPVLNSIGHETRTNR